MSLDALNSLSFNLLGHFLFNLGSFSFHLFFLVILQPGGIFSQAAYVQDYNRIRKNALAGEGAEKETPKVQG